MVGHSTTYFRILGCDHFISAISPFYDYPPMRNRVSEGGYEGGLPINTWKFVFNFSVAAVIKRAHAHTPVFCSKRVDRVGEKGVNRGIGSMPILCIYMYVFVQPSKCKCATINNVHRQTLEKETSGLIKTTQTI